MNQTLSTSVEVSQGFKRQARRAILSIIFFIIVYIILLALAIGLTAYSFYLGILLISVYTHLISIALGVGLMSMGVLLLFFMLKFLFKRHKVDRSHLKEIKRAEEPELFAMIDDIVAKVGTRFPKKVYLSGDINASVFYDSSFWSMFLPIEKNLMVGIGLTNVVTVEELRAILSHEFGHFSQKSMKVGSSVYNVNQVIFNMLFDNESFEKLASGWASISARFTAASAASSAFASFRITSSPG